MKITIGLLAALLGVGCAEVDLATDYVSNKPQTFSTSIPGLDVSTLKVYRSKRHPGKLWVEPNAGKKLSIGLAGRDSQFTAMLPTVIEPAYRDVALRALKDDPGGECKIASQIPWPSQFAIEFSFICQ